LFSFIFYSPPTRGRRGQLKQGRGGEKKEKPMPFQLPKFHVFCKKKEKEENEKDGML